MRQKKVSSATTSRFQENFHISARFDPVTGGITHLFDDNERLPNQKVLDPTRVRSVSAPAGDPNRTHGIGTGNLSLLQHFPSMDDNLLRSDRGREGLGNDTGVRLTGADFRKAGEKLSSLKGGKAGEGCAGVITEAKGTQPAEAVMPSNGGAESSAPRSSTVSSTIVPCPSFDSSASAPTVVCTAPPFQEDDFVLGLENVAQVPDTDSAGNRASTPSHLQEFADVENLIEQPVKKTGIARLFSWTRRKTRKAGRSNA
jgi:hypothetical protein